MLLAPNPNQDSPSEGTTFPGRVYFREHTLTAGNESVTVDFSDLALNSAPTTVTAEAVVKTAAGQDNIYATYVAGTKTASAATFELNAPCDVTGRKLSYTLKI